MPIYQLNDLESRKSNFVDAPPHGQTADINQTTTDPNRNHYFTVIKNIYYEKVFYYSFT